MSKQQNEISQELLYLAAKLFTATDPNKETADVRNRLLEKIKNSQLKDLLDGDQHGNNVLHIACQIGDVDVARAILQKADNQAQLELLLESKNAKDQTPLDFLNLLKDQKKADEIRAIFADPREENLFLVIGKDAGFSLKKGLQEPNTFLFDAENDYEKNIKSLKEALKTHFEQKPHQKIKLIIYAHGEEDGQTIDLGDSKIRDEFIAEITEDLESKITSGNFTIEQFNCSAGAGLLRTKKVDGKKSKNFAGQEEPEGNYNEAFLKESLPIGTTMIINAGKYLTFITINNYLINQIINFKDSQYEATFRKLLLPQTFKIFRKDNNGNLVSEKFDAPKPEEFMPQECWGNNQPLVGGYIKYLEKQCDKMADFLLTDSNLPVQEKFLIKQIQENYKETLKNPTTAKEIVGNYIVCDFLLSSNNSPRVDFYLENQDKIRQEIEDFQFKVCKFDEQYMSFPAVYINSGNITDALKILNSLYSKDPKGAKQIASDCIFELCSKGNIADALKILNSLYIQDPEGKKKIASYCIFDLCYSGNITDALKILNSLYSKNPEGAKQIASDCIFNLCYKGNITDALKILNSLYSKDPKGAKQIASDCIFELCSKGNITDALKILNSLYSKDPEDAKQIASYCFFNLCYKGNITDALKILNSLYNKDPEGAKQIASYCFFELYSNGNITDALKILNSLHSQDQEDAKKIAYHCFLNCCFRGDLTTIEALFDKSRCNVEIDPNYQDENGMLIIVNACCTNLEIAKLIFDRELQDAKLANPHITDLKILNSLYTHKPEGAKQIASDCFFELYSNGNINDALKILNSLYTHDAEGAKEMASDCFFNCCFKGDLPPIEALFDKSRCNVEIDPNYQDEYGRAMLPLVCKNGFTKIAEFLLKQENLDLNACAPNQQPAIITACCTNLEIAKLIFDRALQDAQKLANSSPGSSSDKHQSSEKFFKTVQDLQSYIKIHHLNVKEGAVGMIDEFIKNYQELQPSPSTSLSAQSRSKVGDGGSKTPSCCVIS